MNAFAFDMTILYVLSGVALAIGAILFFDWLIVIMDRIRHWYNEG